MKTQIFGLILSAGSTLFTTAPAPEVTTVPSVSESKPIVTIALVKVKAGTETEFQAAVAKILAPTRQEAGNISYVYNQNLDDSTEFAFVEQWKSIEDLNAHMVTPHMEQFFQEVGQILEPGYPVIKKYLRVEN